MLQKGPKGRKGHGSNTTTQPQNKKKKTVKPLSSPLSPAQTLERGQKLLSLLFVSGVVLLLPLSYTHTKKTLDFLSFVSSRSSSPKAQSSRLRTFFLSFCFCCFVVFQSRFCLPLRPTPCHTLALRSRETRCTARTSPLAFSRWLSPQSPSRRCNSA